MGDRSRRYCVHLNVTYGNIGRWYYVEERKFNLFSGNFFAAFGSFAQAFMTDLLFLIAGYFVPGSYDGKGPGRFAIERLVRLGVPTLLYTLVLFPVLSSSWRRSTRV